MASKSPITLRKLSLRVVVAGLIAVVLIAFVLAFQSFRAEDRRTWERHRTARASSYKSGAEFLGASYSLDKATADKLREIIVSKHFAGSNSHWWDGSAPPPECIADEIVGYAPSIVAVCRTGSGLSIISMIGEHTIPAEADGSPTHIEWLEHDRDFRALKEVQGQVEAYLRAQNLSASSKLLKIDVHKLYGK